MKIQNLLYQPLELDFGKGSVVRIGSRGEGRVPDKFRDHPVLKRNEAAIRIVAQKKPAKEKAIDVEPKTK